MGLILLVVSAFCLAIATLIAFSVFAGNYQGWLAGGLLAYVLSVLLGAAPTVSIRRAPPPSG